MRRPLVAVTLFLVVAFLAGMAPSAMAGWRPTGSGGAAARATTMPVTAAPTATVSNRNVQVSWSAVAFPNGAPVDGYVVRRFNASSGVLQTTLAGCTGTLAGLTCTETALPPGSWRYAVAARKGNWTGADSARSASVTVNAPAMTLTGNTSPNALPATLTGNLTNYLPGQSVTFRLDNATTGTTLTANLNPNSIPATGSATFSVTVPKGTTVGSHTLHAVGNQGDVTSRPFTVNITPPAPTSLVLRNGGPAGDVGRIGVGDRVEVTFSKALDVASICSDWSDDTADQITFGNNVVWVNVANNASASGNDLLTVTVTNAACGGDFNFGSVDLGSRNVVTGNTTFGGSNGDMSGFGWDAGARQLIVQLGAKATGPNIPTARVTSTATYTPDPAILDPNGVPVTGTASSTAQQF